MVHAAIKADNDCFNINTNHGTELKLMEPTDLVVHYRGYSVMC